LGLSPYFAASEIEQSKSRRHSLRASRNSLSIYARQLCYTGLRLKLESSRHCPSLAQGGTLMPRLNASRYRGMSA
jgi:hypothetical protein